MNGIILIDKGKDVTSRDVVNKLCRIFSTKKVGHTGTLDPLATGVLVVCFGKYTKLVDKITSLNKSYRATVKFGLRTDTLDITGKVLEEKSFEVNEEEIKKVLKSFTGKMMQEVPLYSSVRVNGKKLYEYARNGEEVTLPKREIEVFDINFIEALEDGFVFETSVSKGTYIRQLISDISGALNTVGVMTELRRTAQGKFLISECFTLDDVENGDYEVLSIEDIFDYESVMMDDMLYFRVKNGSKIETDLCDGKYFMKYNGEVVAIYDVFDKIGKVEVMM